MGSGDGQSHERSLKFQTVSTWSQSVSSSSQSCCSVLSSRINHKLIQQEQLLHTQPLVSSQTWVFSTSRGHTITFWGLSPHPIQRVGATWELIRGLRYSGLSFPSCLSLSSANLLYREDFPQSTYRVGMSLVSTRGLVLG